MGSGKNTVCDIIQDLCKKNNESYFEQKAFAGKLKTIASMLTGIPVEKFEDQEFKKTNLPEHWNTLQQSGRNKVSLPMTVRELLQKLGTEAMRQGLHTNVWVNALFADYKPDCTPKDAFNKDLPNWIITDMRFPNEMEAVVERKGITIRVNRDADIKVQHSGKEDDFTIEKFDKNNPKHVALKAGQDKMLHPSETALDDAKFDYEIINDAGIPELIEKVREILIKESII